MAEYKFNDNFGFQGEVLYSPLGGKKKIDGVNPETFVGEQTNLPYFIIPVSAKYFITEGFLFLQVLILELSFLLSKTVIGSDFQCRCN
jgi:hypothetical protein